MFCYHTHFWNLFCPRLCCLFCGLLVLLQPCSLHCWSQFLSPIFRRLSLSFHWLFSFFLAVGFEKFFFELSIFLSIMALFLVSGEQLVALFVKNFLQRPCCALFLFVLQLASTSTSRCKHLRMHYSRPNINNGSFKNISLLDHFYFIKIINGHFYFTNIMFHTRAPRTGNSSHSTPKLWWNCIY